MRPVMEDAMFGIRIVAAGAILAVAVGSATAQTVIVPVGKPLPLLQIVEQPSKAKAPLRARREAKAAKWLAKAHKAVAAAKSRHRPAEIATAPVESPPTAVAAVQRLAPANAPVPQPGAGYPGQSTEPRSGEIVVAGQTVQVAASPDDANALDLAAPDQADAAMPMAAADPAPAQQAASATPVARAMVVTMEPQNASTVGSASWIAQVLAALAGAIAAAVAAWFLIGVTPRRTYG